MFTEVGVEDPVEDLLSDGGTSSLRGPDYASLRVS